MANGQVGKSADKGGDCDHVHNVEGYHCREHECNDSEDDCKNSQKNYPPGTFVLAKERGARSEQLDTKNDEHNTEQIINRKD